jgi:hypothetical protein
MTRFPVDREHSALRLTVLGAFIAAWVVGFLVFSALISSQSGLNLLAVILAFGVAYAVTFVLERTLKGRWSSGRVLEVDADGVRLLRHGTAEAEARAGDGVQVLHWRFEITRRARVPKGWSMLALGLSHNERALTVYTFVSPKQLEDLSEAERYVRLIPRKEQKPTARSQQTSLRTDLSSAGEQRRLMDAEAQRWMNGGEMLFDDFLSYTRLVDERFPEWQPLE